MNRLFTSISIACAAILTAIPAPAGAGAAEGPGYPYTLADCPVSGRALGSMGAPVVREYDGREVRFCCRGCIEEFEDNPAEQWSEIDEGIVRQQLMHYPLGTCIVTGKELDEAAINHVHNNRLVRLAGADALAAFKADPARFLKKLDERIIEAQGAGYPLETCPVSGSELGSMGEPVGFVYMNRLVRLCCAGCESQLVENPDEHMAELDKAYAERQRDGYPAETCPVSGQKLGSMGEPAELVAGSRLVRFCCKGCFPMFRKEPETFLRKIAAD